MDNYKKKYIEYKQKYINLKNDLHIYYEIKGSYNGCSIVLFPSTTTYNLDHDPASKNKNPNFFKKLSKLTITFSYDPPEYAASKVVDKNQKSLIFPTKQQLKYDNYVELIYKILKNNSVKPPYVVIGHSLTAFIALVFGKKYSKDVKAVILLDGTRHCNKMYEGTKKGFDGATIINAKDNDMKNIVEKFINTKSESPDKEIKLEFKVNDKVTLEKIKLVEGHFEKNIIHTFNKGINIWKDKQIEILLALNNVAFFEKIKNWNSVPDKVDNIKIVGIWNIWIANEEKHKNVDISKKFNAQIEFLETMKEYHELLQKQNKDNYDSYFFFGQSHFLQYSNTDEVISIIKRYL